MYNLTVSLDAAIVREARIRAIGEGTSVSAMVREFLQHYVKLGAAVLKSTTEETVKPSAQQAAMARFIARAKNSPYHSGDEKWSRDALYDRKIAGG